MLLDGWLCVIAFTEDQKSASAGLDLRRPSVGVKRGSCSITVTVSAASSIGSHCCSTLAHHCVGLRSADLLGAEAAAGRAPSSLKLTVSTCVQAEP